MLLFQIFYAYVYLVALVFMIYASIATRVVKDKTTHDNGIPLPSIILGKEGVNIYLTFAIIGKETLSVTRHCLQGTVFLVL